MCMISPGMYLLGIGQKSKSIYTHVENNVCSNVIYRTVSAISVSIPPVRHALVTTVELKYLNCRHSNVRIGGIRDNNVTFYMGSLPCIMT